MLTNFTFTMVGSVINGSITNHPNSTLDFSKNNYEVCILDMLFMPGSWDNVRAGKNIIRIRQNGEMQPSVQVPAKHYKYSSDLISAVNTAANNLFSLSVSFKQLNIYLGGNKGLEIQFCTELAHLFGMIETMTAPLPWITAAAPMWNMPDIDIKRNNISKLWMFADFVRNTIIGPLQKPLLRYAPIRVGSGVLEHSVFSIHQYAKCKMSTFSSLRITFYEELSESPLQIHDPV